MTTTTISDTDGRDVRGRRRADHAGSAALVFGSMTSAHIGAAVATSLFATVGAPGAVLLRQGLGAVFMLGAVRPRLSGRSRTDWTSVVLLGLVFAVMNTCLYEAFDRLPLGGAVTIELLGPLGLAVVLSRRARDVALVGLAGVGVLLLEGLSSDVNLAGVLFALVAAGGWASYIVLSTRVGRRFAGADGIALAMPVAAIAIAPFGVVTGGLHLLRPAVLGVGAVVAVLSAVIPFTFEVHALRRVPQRIFGVIQSMSPVIAALVGWLALGQRMGVFQVAAVGCVVAACAGTVWSARSGSTA